MFKAFTLAEVLITLGVIGIIAALTIPGVITNYNKIVTVNRLKKVYSSFEQSISMAKAKYGEEMFIPNCGSKDYCNDYNPELLIEALQPIQCEKYLNDYVNIIRKGLNGYTQYASLSQCKQLKDGTIFFTSYSSGYTLYLIDINGARNPNRFGKDLFTFIYVPQIPMYYSKTAFGNDVGSIYTLNTDKPKLYPAGYREDVGWTACSGKGTGNCTYKIIKDGWQIKNDYPW